MTNDEAGEPTMKIYERIATTHAEFTQAVTDGYDELISSLPCYELLTQFEPVAPHRDGGMIYKAYAHPAIGEALSATIIDRSMASAR